MNILVTGAAGYVGSHFCKLHKDHFNIIGIDNLTRGNLPHFQGAKLYELDIRQTDEVYDVLIENNVDLVVHFAALAYVGESCAEPLEYYDNNVAGTISLLHAMERASVNKLIFSSSCATYGSPDQFPIREATNQEPINPYGQSKLICERMISDQCNSKNLTAISLRYFNVIGGDPSMEIGELHDPETHILPNVIKAAIDPDFILDVFGNDYNTPDGTCERDYIDVCDLAEAHGSAATKLMNMKSPYCDFINIGRGKPISILEIIKQVETQSKLAVKYRVLPRRPGDAATLYADPTRARSVLNWIPRRNIEQSIENAYSWHLKNR